MNYREYAVMGIRSDNCVQIVDWCTNEDEAIQSAKSMQAGRDDWKYSPVYADKTGHWNAIIEGDTLHYG